MCVCVCVCAHVAQYSSMADYVYSNGLISTQVGTVYGVRCTLYDIGCRGRRPTQARPTPEGPCPGPTGVFECHCRSWRQYYLARPACCTCVAGSPLALHDTHNLGPARPMCRIAHALLVLQLRASINRWMPLCRGAARLCGVSRWGWACKAAAWVSGH